MRWGSPWSSGWGNPENHFVYFIPDLTAMQASGYTYLPVRFKLRSGLDGAYAGIYYNGAFLKNVYTDVEFSELRKNPRFTQLMALSIPIITN